MQDTKSCPCYFHGLPFKTFLAQGLIYLVIAKCLNEYKETRIKIRLVLPVLQSCALLAIESSFALPVGSTLFTSACNIFHSVIQVVSRP